MLGTGVRIGEACALRVPQVDIEGATVEISATVTDFGIEERPKTKAGWRVIAVPPNVGLSARSIADHRGHAQPSMTQDVYMGRRVASSDAANVLDR